MLTLQTYPEQYYTDVKDLLRIRLNVHLISEGKRGHGQIYAMSVMNVFHRYAGKQYRKLVTSLL